MDENKTQSETPKHRHETREAVPRYILYFAGAVAVIVAISFLVSWGVLTYFRTHPNYPPPQSALAGRRVLPPLGMPRLQAHPATDLQVYLQHEREILDTYGWVDRKDGIVRIPIQRAMALLLKQKLLPISNSKTPKGAVQPGEVQQYTVPQGYMPPN